MLDNLEYIYKLFLKYPVISIDSRNIIKDSIFWALKGDNFDGNDFVKDAINKGASFAITDNINNVTDERIIYVENSLTALQQLALLYRNSLNAKVIGITGTNGKTTTKELVKEILSQKYKTIANKGNFNNHIGLPLTILSADDDCEIIITEMGANHPGEIIQLCSIAKPDYGIITNIGKAHLEGFGTYENIVETKKALYDFVNQNGKLLFVNADNKLLMNLSKNYRKITYGSNTESDCKVYNMSKSIYPEIQWRYNNNTGFAKTNLAGNYNFENVAAAVCVAAYFNVPSQSISYALTNYYPLNNRSQYIKTKNNVLIMDAYNANPTSMQAAIESFALSDFVNKTLILGDMLELGNYKIEEHKNIIDFIKKFNFKKVILVGENFYNLNTEKNFISFPDTNSAHKWLKKNVLANYTILLKGSRNMKIDTLADCL